MLNLPGMISRERESRFGILTSQGSAKAKWRSEAKDRAIVMSNIFLAGTFGYWLTGRSLGESSERKSRPSDLLFLEARKESPNQLSEPMSGGVTPCADAHVAPPPAMAHR